MNACESLCTFLICIITIFTKLLQNAKICYYRLGMIYIIVQESSSIAGAPDYRPLGSLLIFKSSLSWLKHLHKRYSIYDLRKWQPEPYD